jgi:hypothetical protein
MQFHTSKVDQICPIAVSTYLTKTELGLTRGKISPTTFPLQEAFSKELRGINDEVNNGRGFAVLRGLQPLDYSEEDVIILYAGLTSHVASHRAGFIGDYLFVLPSCFGRFKDLFRLCLRSHPLRERG